MLNGGSGDADHVKTRGSGLDPGAADVIAGGAAQGVNLVAIDGALGRAPLARGPELDFHKDQCFAFPGDEVNFAAALRRPPVPRHDDAAEPPEKTVCNVLAAAAVIAVEAIAKQVGEPVQVGRGAQTQIPSPCRERHSKDKTPRTGETAGNGSRETQSRAISRKRVA